MLVVVAWFRQLFSLLGIDKAVLWLTSSFDVKTDGGASARKLTAFAFICMSAYLHKYYVDEKNVFDVLIVDCAMILLLLAVVTFEQIIKFKANTGKNNTQVSEQPKEEEQQKPPKTNDTHRF